MPITRRVFCLERCAAISKLPLYTIAKPQHSPLFSVASGAHSAAAGLWKCPGMPIQLPTDCMPERTGARSTPFSCAHAPLSVMKSSGRLPMSMLRLAAFSSASGASPAFSMQAARVIRSRSS